MKTLIVYYSRTGTTKKVAEMLARKLEADTEEIKDTVNRSGVIGYLKSGRDAMKRSLTVLETVIKNPADYDLVIIGTPLWANNMTPSIRTYLTGQKEKLKEAAFFCTMGGLKSEKAFSEMEDVSGKKPVAVMPISTKEVVKGEYEKKVDEYVLKLAQ